MILLFVEKYFSDSVSCVEGALLISLRCCDWIFRNRWGRFHISNNYIGSTISLVQSADRTSVNVSLNWRTLVTPILLKNECSTSVNVSLKRRTSVTPLLLKNEGRTSVNVSLNWKTSVTPLLLKKWRQNFGKCLIKLENFGNSSIVKKWRQNFGKCLIKTENFGNSYFVIIEDNTSVNVSLKRRTSVTPISL